jgi:large subunit ribosomal protein L32
MISPKQKLSKSRRDKRRAQTWKIAMPNLVACSKCKALMQSHRMCKECGSYDRREILKTAQ